MAQSTGGEPSRITIGFDIWTNLNREVGHLRARNATLIADNASLVKRCQVANAQLAQAELKIKLLERLGQQGRQTPIRDTETSG